MKCPKCKKEVKPPALHLCGADDNALNKQAKELRQKADYDVYGNKVWII